MVLLAFPLLSPPSGDLSRRKGKGKGKQKGLKVEIFKLVEVEKYKGNVIGG